MDESIEDVRERKRRCLVEEAATEPPPDEPVEIDGREAFEDTIETYDLVLVDFHADWCGPCKALEPTVEALAAETDAAVLKVDIDELQGLAAEFNVRSVPTLVLFAGGEVAERVTGVREQRQLESLIERHA